MAILITGVAGFIGNALAASLLRSGEVVIGVDNLNAYYDVRLKRQRLHRLSSFQSFSFEEASICDKNTIEALFKQHTIKVVVHLAAQAGVRHSLTYPEDYVEMNLQGFANILFLSKTYQVEHFLYASSSSVYGDSTESYFIESQQTDTPLSFYAATKKANEIMASSYASLYGLPVTGMRFFSVYGPWGRPDMAMFKFATAIQSGKSFDLYNGGDMIRDFTYIEDAISGIKCLLQRPLDRATRPAEVYNVATGRGVSLKKLVAIIEDNLNTKAQYNNLPLQVGDTTVTCANIDKLKALGYQPKTSIETGVANFLAWHQALSQGEAIFEAVS